MAVKAIVGRAKTICSVSIKALKNPRSCRSSHGNPPPGAGVADGVIVDVAPAGGGGAVEAAAANSGNCESDCQLAMPSRQPNSLSAKRQVRNPSVTSSSENAPRLVAPRLTWIIAIILAF